MPLSYLLSFVEVSLITLDFDELGGRILKCCSRSLMQFADLEKNLRALDIYDTYRVDQSIEAIQDQEAAQDLALIYHTLTLESDDY